MLVAHLFWIPIGVTVNIFALAAANVGVVVLIFAASSPMEMLLNVVALSFVFELDDALMSKRDYKARNCTFRLISLG